MTAADVTSMTAVLDPVVIIAGIVVLGGLKFGPAVARWGIGQIQRMVRG